MTRKEQIALVAEFMDMKEEAPDFWVDTNFGHPVILGPYNPDQDWNELMPVVEKVERLDCVGRFYIFSTFAKITPDIFHEFLFLGLAGTKIKAVYQVIIKFLQWYKENKKP